MSSFKKENINSKQKLGVSELTKGGRGYAKKFLEIISKPSKIWYEKNGIIRSGTVDTNGSSTQELRKLIKENLTSFGDIPAGVMKGSYYVDVKTTGNKREKIFLTSIFKDQVKVKKEDVLNFGEYTEAILAVSIFCRMFTKSNLVTKPHVEHVLKDISSGKHNAKGSNIYIARRARNRSGTEPDYVRLYISPKGPVFRALNTVELIDSKEAQKIIDGAIKYANSEKIDDIASQRYNSVCEFVDVYADGAIDEKSKKDDVRVVIRNAIGKNGDSEPGADIIAVIKASVKYNSIKQFGQAGGKTFDGHVKFWKRLCNIDVSRSKMLFDLEIKSLDWKSAFERVFVEAYDQINTAIKINDEIFAENLGGGIRWFATMDDDDVEMVNIGKKGFQTYNFNNAVDVMKNLNIRAVRDPSKMQIKFLANNEVFLSVRGKFEGDGKGAARMYVEKEAGFDLIFGTK